MTYDYKAFIEDNFQIIDKDAQLIDFKLNAIQNKYLSRDCTGKDIILKARQQGFSSLIEAIFAADFIGLRENSYSVIVADRDENADLLLQKIKGYIQSFEMKNKEKLPVSFKKLLKYDSRYELFNQFMNSRITIGTAKNTEFGRSRTINNLHLSEVAFYPDIEKILAGAGNAVVPNGMMILETTANGFNEFKELWDDCKEGNGDFKPLFYKASDFYPAEFLAAKRNSKQTKRLAKQEYPESDIEAFIASGDCFFDLEALELYLKRVATPLPFDSKDVCYTGV